MHGRHLVKHWCRAQHTIALSSGEAELYAACAGGASGLGLLNVVHGLGLTNMRMVLYLDAEATKGAISRKGVGRMKHIEVKYLWIQPAVHQKRFICCRISRDINCSDLLTHAWGKVDGERHLKRMGVVAMDEP